LPFKSVTLSTIELSPVLAHVNESGIALKDAIPHTSADPLSSSLPDILTNPLLFSARTSGLADAKGLMVSRTCTVVTAESLFPYTSVMIKVTVLLPTATQVNVAGLTSRVAIEQLSDDDESTWAALTEATPDEFK
jgi:hypothetical protein